MNERSAMVLRCVVAAWLVYTGVSLIYDVVRAKPNNMVLMICFGTFFAVFGIGFAVLTIRRYMADMKADSQEEIEEASENSAYAAEEEAGEGHCVENRGVGVASVDLKASVRAEENAETKSEASEEEPIKSEIDSETSDTEKEQSEEAVQEPAEDTSKTELTAEKKE